MPAFVPTSLAQSSSAGGELSKPILFDCDYEFSRSEDSHLAVKWFKNKELEPFYQWLPELQVRHFADWIKPLINDTFAIEPNEPLKRYRSLAIKRLSFNLTGSYSCLVSSLASQDMREAPLVVYAPPRALAFEHRVFPAPAGSALLAPPTSAGSWPSSPTFGPVSLSNGQESALQSLVGPGLGQRHAIRPSGGGGGPSGSGAQASPTQFRALVPAPQGPPAGPAAPAPASVLVRPPNNQHHLNQSVPLAYDPTQQQQQQQQPPPQAKIVYTHDGRPIRRKSRQLAGGGGEPEPVQWQLRQRLNALQQRNSLAASSQAHQLQLHHFQCAAKMVHPRPVLVLTVKRQADSIAQYLHESSSFSIRPHQVAASELLAQPHQQQQAGPTGSGAPSAQLVTVYDITVSATVALNVTLPPLASLGGELAEQQQQQYSKAELQLNQMVARQQQQQQQQPGGINTVLAFRRGQRMTFECHLEITGTDFGRRERININETGE